MKQKVEYLEDFGAKSLMIKLNALIADGCIIQQVIDCGGYKWLVIYNAT